MRTLIIVPIIQTESDMGSLLGQIKRKYIQKFGHGKWSEHLKSIDKIWIGIRKMLILLDPPYPLLRLYQDGLPVSGKELEIIHDVAQQGSTNDQLLLELMQHDARLQGTEDAALLLQEYRIQQSSLRDGEPDLDRERCKQGRQLLLQRDRFIADQINLTLLPGEIGLLFLGLAHEVDPLLAHDLLVCHLLPPLKEIQHFETSEDEQS
jgi:hypothetical protein